MATCFINNEEFDVEFIKEGFNIISVTSKTEIYFDVFECLLGSKNIILEKIDTREDNTVVVLEVTYNDKKYVTDAVLIQGDESFIKLNEKNLFLTNDNNLIKENIEEVEDEIGEEKNQTPDLVTFLGEKIEDYTDSKLYEKIEELKSFSADNLYKNIEHFNEKKKEFLNTIENEFEKSIQNLNEEIDLKIQKYYENTNTSNKALLAVQSKKLKDSINEKYNSFIDQINNLKNFNKDTINSILEEKSQNIKDSLNIFLENFNTENKESFSKLLNEKIDSSEKNINSELTELKNTINDLSNNNIIISKNNKNLFEETNKRFNDLNKKIKILSEKRNDEYNELLAAVNNKDVVEYKTILKEKIEEAELSNIKQEILKEVSGNFNNEISSMKRYAEASAGGGTNAKQFARGGTMEGTLDVTTGEILSAGINITNLLSSSGETDTLQIVTDRGNTTTNSISTNNTITADTIIATTLLSAGTLDIGFELSGFNVTGSVSANGDITGNRVIAINTLSANGNLYPQTIASDGEVIVANGDGNLVFGHGEKLHLQIRNDEGSVIDAGTPIYSRGEIGGSERIKVGIADASDPAKMPAIGIAETTLNTSSTQDGFAIINGVYNENISGFTDLVVGRNLYVASGGGLTNVKPTGFGNLIQNIGTILKAGAGDTMLQGMKVSSIDRTNDIPNLSAKAIFYGQGDYYVQQSLSAAVLDSTGVTLQDGNITTTGSISTNNLLTTNSIKSCSISACNLFVDDTDGKVDLCNNSLCFTNEGRDVRIEHKDCVGTSSANACNLIINASDSASSGTGTAGCLILSAGSSTAPGGNAGNVIICAGAGSITGGDICLNADDTGVGGNGCVVMTTNIICLNAPNVRVETDSNFCVGTGVSDRTYIRNGTIKSQNIHLLNGACIANTLSAQNTVTEELSAKGKITGNADSNINTGNNAAVLGGSSNEVTGSSSFVGAGSLNKNNSNLSIIGGGTGNQVTGVLYGQILGGKQNTVSSGNNSVVGGKFNHATCAYSFVGTGTSLSACGNYGAAVGGRCNVVCGNCGFIGGGYANFIANGESGSTIAGGIQNGIDSDCSFIGGGKLNNVCGNYGTIGGGRCNIVCNGEIDATIAGGFCNKIDGDRSFLGGGLCNCVTDGCSVAVGGMKNCNTKQFSFLGGGCCNRIAGNSHKSFLGGGTCNCVCGNYGVIVGGKDNRINQGTDCANFIGGGQLNFICSPSQHSVIVGGCANKITGNGCCIFIGGGKSNCVASNYSVIVGGNNNKNLDSISTCHVAIVGGKNNLIQDTAIFSFIGGGCGNTLNGQYGGILGGCNNTIREADVESFIIGTDITTDADCTTFVDCIKIGGTVRVAGCTGVTDSNIASCTTINVCNGIIVDVS